MVLELEQAQLWEKGQESAVTAGQTPLQLRLDSLAARVSLIQLWSFVNQGRVCLEQGLSTSLVPRKVIHIEYVLNKVCGAL